MNVLNKYLHRRDNHCFSAGVGAAHFARNVKQKHANMKAKQK